MSPEIKKKLFRTDKVKHPKTDTAVVSYEAPVTTGSKRRSTRMWLRSICTADTARYLRIFNPSVLDVQPRAPLWFMVRAAR